MAEASAVRGVDVRESVLMSWASFSVSCSCSSRNDSSEAIWCWEDEGAAAAVELVDGDERGEDSDVAASAAYRSGVALAFRLDAEFDRGDRGEAEKVPRGEAAATLNAGTVDRGELSAGGAAAAEEDAVDPAAKDGRVEDADGAAVTVGFRAAMLEAAAPSLLVAAAARGAGCAMASAKGSSSSSSAAAVCF